MKGVIIYHKNESKNRDNDNNQNIYASMARISGNDKRPIIYVGDISQLTNWNLDSRSTSHMAPQVLYFVPGLLEDTDKFIEVADGHHITAKKKGQFQSKNFNENGDPFNSNISQHTFCTRSM